MNVTIVIPCAGEGKRFSEVGYTLPKPLIPIQYKGVKYPMIDLVMSNLGSPSQLNVKFVFIVKQSHCDKYHIDTKIKETLGKWYAIEPIVIPIECTTEGAACTVLKARKFIDNEDAIVIANSDQYIDWYAPLFWDTVQDTDSDGAMVTFHSTHPKWSFAALNEEGYVTRVAEKDPISTYATVGIYYFKKGSDFVWAADEMIHKDKRVNGEFYVCPVFNELIVPKNKKILAYPIPTCSMHGLGTPEDLKRFEELYG